MPYLGHPPAVIIDNGTGYAKIVYYISAFYCFIHLFSVNTEALFCHICTFYSEIGQHNLTVRKEMKKTDL